MHRRSFLIQTAGAAFAGALFPAGAFAAGASSGADSGTPAYVPGPKPAPVVGPGEFVFAAAHLDHSHALSQCRFLIEAGATLKWVYEPDARKRDSFLAQFKQARVARALDEILADPGVRLVTAAAVPSERGPLGCRVMAAGKDYFTDKAPFTTLEQLQAAREVAAKTGRKYMVNYGERLTSEAGMFATDLLQAGVLGRVVTVAGFGPHKLRKATRPAWFFERARYGGILCDLGSHQCEQFLTFAAAQDARLVHSAVGNFANPDRPELEDFGEAAFVCDNGASSQIRVDWLTPAGLGSWGDGRTFIVGTKGCMELRHQLDLGRERTTDHLYLVDERGEHHLQLAGRVGFRFFGELILDCLHRTEKAMTQAHAFKAAELSLRAQAEARRLT